MTQISVLVFFLLDQVAAAPNILLILADDLGVNDVSWNNPASETPSLARLARAGVVLDTAYTLPVCSPSRAALLTGIYPFKYGFQRGFGKNIPEGIPLNIKLLPEYLKSVGYSTHAFGKWHLGFCSESYLPLNRGFDTFNGLYVGDEEDFNRKGKNTEKEKISELLYKDQAKNRSFLIYFAPLTKVYPNQRNPFQDIIKERREKISQLDQAVDLITKTLVETGQYENTVIIFMSDNGGRFIKKASNSDNPNFPLRGFKNTIYEGGTRVPAFISSPLLNQTNTRYPGLLHMVDLLPTVLRLAGYPHATGLDGVDQWEAVSEGLESPREWLVYNMDDVFVPNFLVGPRSEQQKFQIGLRNYRFKLVWGQAGMLYRGYRHPQYSEGGIQTQFQTLQLFDLKTDPGETRNIAARRKTITDKFIEKALEFYREVVPPRFSTSQSVISVLDRREEAGAVTGWCRAGLETSCSPPPSQLFSVNITDTLTSLLYGTLDREHPTFCLTKLQTI